MQRRSFPKECAICSNERIIIIKELCGCLIRLMYPFKLFIALPEILGQGEGSLQEDCICHKGEGTSFPSLYYCCNTLKEISETYINICW